MGLGFSIIRLIYWIGLYILGIVRYAHFKDLPNVYEYISTIQPKADVSDAFESSLMIMIFGYVIYNIKTQPSHRGVEKLRE